MLDMRLSQRWLRKTLTSLEITTFYVRYEVITEVITKNIIFCHVMHFSPKEIHGNFRETYCLHFCLRLVGFLLGLFLNLEDGVSKSLLNVGKFLQNYTASYHKKQHSSLDSTLTHDGNILHILLNTGIFFRNFGYSRYDELSRNVCGTENTIPRSTQTKMEIRTDDCHSRIELRLLCAG
jgi:hypothetical protein